MHCGEGRRKQKQSAPSADCSSSKSVEGKGHSEERETSRRAWPVRVREILAKAPAAGTTEADGNKSTIIWCVMIHRGTSVGVKTAVHHGGNTVSSVPLFCLPADKMLEFSVPGFCV